MKCCMKLTGATVPTRSRSAVPTTRSAVVRFDALRNSASSRAAFASGVSSTAFALGFAAAIAATLGGGGGKVTAPAWVTVAPRMTSSSMLTTGVPSFAGVRSSIMWRTLFE